MESRIRDPQEPLSVDEAWDEITRVPGFNPNLKIQAIKEMRHRTGLSLKEAKAAVDERLGDISLEAIMADLKRREGREVDEQTRTAINDPHGVWQIAEPVDHLVEPNGHKAIDPWVVKVERRRESNREASRRYRARIRAQLDASRPPVQPSHEEIAWALVGALVGAIGTDARQVLGAAGLTIALVKKNGKG